jgi:2-hydroxychromene-2-carboxylate isomerase
MAATFYYDLESPYAWLAAERIDDVFAAPVDWVPVLAGAIFAANDRRSWGLGPERADGIAVIERRVAERGLPAMTWPDPFPGNGLRAQRAAVHAHRKGAGKPFALAAFRVHFVDGRTLDDEQAIAEAAQNAGLDGAAVLAATADQAVKDELRANTDRALAEGVFGVPTVVVGGTAYWGDDRLEDAAAAA